MNFLKIVFSFQRQMFVGRNPSGRNATFAIRHMHSYSYKLCIEWLWLMLQSLNSSSKHALIVGFLVIGVRFLLLKQVVIIERSLKAIRLKGIGIIPEGWCIAMHSQRRIAFERFS